MSKFASLPTEVLDAICEPLATQPNTLAAVSRTCCALYSSSVRLLYRDISASAFACNLPVVHTLAKNPRLARLVRNFSVTVDNADGVFRPFYQDLRNALPNMTGLFSLHLLVDPAAGWILPVGEGVAEPLYPRLEHFTCTFPLDNSLSAFLSHTPALLSLELSAVIPASAASLLPSTHIPLLETYTGPASLLPTMGSRPLTAIYLSGDLSLDDLPQPSASLMSAPSKEVCGEVGLRVQVFSAITSVQPALMLESIAKAYPALTCLRLMTTCAFWDAPNMVRFFCLCALRENSDLFFF